MIFAFFLLRSALAQSAPDLSVRQSSSDGGKVGLEAFLSWAPLDGIDWKASAVSREGALGVVAVPLPTDLKLLVDTSALCSVNKADQMAMDLLGFVKRGFSPNSRVTVIGYNSHEMEIYENRRRVREWSGTQIQCQARTVSTPFTKALTTAFQNGSKDLPATVWILTSGNVRLEAEALKLLKRTKSQVSLVLYNTVLESAIRPMVQQAIDALGRSQIGFSAYNSSKLVVPSQGFGLDVDVPSGASTQDLSLSLAAAAGGKDLAKQNLAVTIAADRGGKLRSFWLKVIAGLAAVSLGLYVLFALYRFYRPRYCAKCKRRIRYRNVECRFCHSEDRPYLSGTFNLSDPRKWGRIDLFPLGCGTYELGTHRKSVIPFLRKRGQRRECMARLEGTEFRKGSPSFRVIRIGTPGSLRVNGLEVKGHRYLASGDVIEVQGQPVDFFFAQRSES